jgi:hypothetical protein
MGKTSADSIQYQDLLAKAVRLRLAKTPYDEIIAKLGHWNSIQACQKAVSIYLKRNQAKKVEDSRAEAIAILEDQLFEMRAKFKKSKSRFDSAEIRKLVREISLLNGDYAPTKIAETDAQGNDKPKVVVYLPDNNRDQ